MQIPYISVLYTLLFVNAIKAIPADPRSTLPRPKACVASPDWVVSSHLRPSDCVQALDIFRRAESQKDDSQPSEFLARGARPASELLTLTTPRKYRFGSCTVVVAMFASIPPWFLDESTMERRRFAPNDVASLDELREAAKQIIATCVQLRERRPLVGWQEMGRLSKAIGVFVWETGSPIDRALRPWSDLMLPGIGNETAPVRGPSLEA
ncbi:MAG: hypothetical protein LQ349_001410 [Xanthoria aureola]|nr:MAG: hypothetical protein LQ349_001410 [Xanthoria aureola]